MFLTVGAHVLALGKPYLEVTPSKHLREGRCTAHCRGDANWRPVDYYLILFAETCVLEAYQTLKTHWRFHGLGDADFSCRGAVITG